MSLDGIKDYSDPDDFHYILKLKSVFIPNSQTCNYPQD